MRIREKRFIPIIILVFSFFSFVCGCGYPVRSILPGPIFPGKGWEPDSPQEYFAKAKKHYQLAKEASEFSNSLALMHYVAAMSGLNYYNGSVRKENTIEGITSRELENKIIPDTRELARKEAESNIFDLALYLFAIEHRTRSVPVSVDLKLVADAMDKYGDKSRADKIKKHAGKLKSLYDNQLVANDMESAYKSKIESVKQKGKGSAGSDDIDNTDGSRIRMLSMNDRYRIALSQLKNRQYDKTRQYFRELSETSEWKSNPDIFKDLFSAIDTDEGVSTIFSIVSSIKTRTDDLKYTLIIYLTESIRDNENLRDWKKHLERIREKLTETKKFHPLKVIAEIKVAEAYKAKGNTQVADEILQKSVDVLKKRTIYVRDDKSLIQGIEALIEMGNEKEARGVLDASSKKHESSSEEYGDIQIAQGYALLGDQEKIEDVFNDIFKAGNSRHVTEATIIKSYIELAYYFHKLNNTKKTNECLDYAIRMFKEKGIDPHGLNSELVFNRYLFSALKDYKQIREFADLMDGPSNDPFMSAISESYSAEGNLDQAFETAKHMDRAQWKAQRMGEIAIGYLDNGDWQKAYAVWEYLENDEASQKLSNTQPYRNNIKNGVVMEMAFQGYYDKAVEASWRGNENLDSVGYIARGLMLRALDRNLDESEQRRIIESIAQKVFEFEYLQGLKGVKEPELAKNAENDLVQCAEYLADPRNIYLNKMGSPQDDWRKSGHPRIMIALAKGYVELGMKDKALEKLDAANKEVISDVETEKYDSSDHSELLDIADLLIQLNEKDKAMKILDYVNEKRVLLLNELNVQPNDVSDLFRAYYKAGEIGKAQAIIDEMRSRPPKPKNDAVRNYANNILFRCLIIQGKYDEVLKNPSAADHKGNVDRWIWLIVNEERDSGNYKSALEYIKKINDLDLRLRLITGLINTNIDDETSSELDSSVDTIIKEITGYAECYKAVEIICEIAQKYAEFRKEDRGFSILKTLTETVNQIKDRRSKEIARWLIATSYANLGDFVNAKKVKPSRSTVDDKYGYFPAQIYIQATAVGYARNGDYDKAMRVTREYNNRYKKSPYAFLAQMAAVGIERGDYDKAYSILETAYDTRWKDEHNYPQCNIITTPWEYHFRECPKWFLDVNRVDLAIKCLRFISSDRLGGSDTVEALMMIEKKRREIGYTLKDSDTVVLRGIIHSNNLFASYNRNFVEVSGLNEVTIEI